MVTMDQLLLKRVYVCGDPFPIAISESLVDIEGDVYVVERYESDVEEEKLGSGGAGTGGGGATRVRGRGSRDQVMIRLSDGFLEEIDDVSAKVCL